MTAGMNFNFRPISDPTVYPGAKENLYLYGGAEVKAGCGAAGFVVSPGEGNWRAPSVYGWEERLLWKKGTELHWGLSGLFWTHDYQGSGVCTIYGKVQVGDWYCNNASGDPDCRGTSKQLEYMWIVKVLRPRCGRGIWNLQREKVMSMHNTVCENYIWMGST